MRKVLDWSRAEGPEIGSVGCALCHEAEQFACSVFAVVKE